MWQTIPLHYSVRGNRSGPTIVFLHGFMGSIEDWDAIIDTLAKTFLCIAIDLPGHGQTTRLPDDRAYAFSDAVSAVVKVMEETQSVPAIVVGYSMGGRLALYMAWRYRHVCAKLILESTTAGISDDTERKKRKALDENRATKLKEGPFEDFLRTWYCQPVFQTLADAPKKFERVIQKRLVNDPKELALAMVGMSVGVQPSLWPRLSDVTMPVLMLVGEQDSKYVRIAQSMATKLPDGHVSIIPEAGHNVHLERPTLMTDHIKNFALKE